MRSSACVLALATLALAACGEGAKPSGSTATPAGHVHGLGVDPADGALYVATHNGLFHAPEGESDAARVGSSEQDTMGFTVVGANRFLGSGHPGPGEGGPTSLGLIESTDAGQSWESLALAGEADFHILRYVHGRVYAYNALTGKLMLSEDDGKSWDEHTPPGALIDLAVDPSDPERIVVASERGLAMSEDDGDSWQPVDGEIGLLAWPSKGSLYLIDARGQVASSREAGSAWHPVGSIGGQPAALATNEAGELLAALGDGSVLGSTDGGATWEARASVR